MKKVLRIEVLYYLLIIPLVILQYAKDLFIPIDFEKKFYFYKAMQSYYRELGDQQTLLYYEQVIKLIEKIDKSLTMMILIFIAFVHIFVKSKMTKKKLKSYPSVLYDYKRYEKLNHLCFYVMLILFLIYINYNLNMKPFLEFLVYLSIFLVFGIIFIYISTKLTNNVIQRVKYIELEEFDKLNEVELVYRDTQLNEWYVMFAVLLISVAGYFSWMTYHRINTYLVNNIPENLVLNNDLKHNQNVNEQVCSVTESTYFDCTQYSLLMEEYKIKQIKLTINNDDMIKKLQNNQYQLIVQYYYKSIQPSDVQIENNQIMIHFSDDTPFKVNYGYGGRYISIWMIENNKPIELFVDDYELILVRK